MDKFKLKVFCIVALCALLGAVLGWFTHALVQDFNSTDFIVKKNTCLVYLPDEPRLAVFEGVNKQQCDPTKIPELNGLDVESLHDVQYFKFNYPVNFIVVR